MPVRSPGEASRRDLVARAGRTRGIPALVLMALAAVLAIVAGLAALTWPAKSEAQGTVRATAINVSATNTGSTVFTLRLDRNVRYRHFALPEPAPRLVVDLDRVAWAVQGSSQTGSVTGAGLIRSVRFAHKSATESRLVLDLAGPVRVVRHEIEGGLTGRMLRIEMAPAAGTAAMAKSAPPPSPTVTAGTGAVSGPVRRDARSRRFVVVIDPGHGGRDPGATGHSGRTYEKDVVLASALLLRDYLRRDPRLQVVLTRETDVFLPLERRIVVAREARADLFISLHADAAPPEARVNGATVYTLSEEGGERARRLLNTENWTIAPANRTRDNAVVSILKDLTQRDTKNQSAVFAQSLIDRLRPVSPLTGSSHRRAGFFVLLSPTVPAVLLEMGFMTNAEDEARLNDPRFRQRQMRATADAISAYFSRPEVAGARAAPGGR